MVRTHAPRSPCRRHLPRRPEADAAVGHRKAAQLLGRCLRHDGHGMRDRRRPKPQAGRPASAANRRYIDCAITSSNTSTALSIPPIHTGICHPTTAIPRPDQHRSARDPIHFPSCRPFGDARECLVLASTVSMEVVCGTVAPEPVVPAPSRRVRGHGVIFQLWRPQSAECRFVLEPRSSFECQCAGNSKAFRDRMNGTGQCQAGSRADDHMLRRR